MDGIADFPHSGHSLQCSASVQEYMSWSHQPNWSSHASSKSRPLIIVKRRGMYDQPVGVYHRNSLPRMVLVSRTRRHLKRRPSTRQFSTYPFHHLYFRIVSDSMHSFFCSESRQVPSGSRDELPSENSPLSTISNIRVGRIPLRQ